jgi:CheY-like chemotaxis protein
VNLTRVVTNIERMLRRIIGEDVELVTELAGDLADVRIDPGQADQIIMNLAVNARDAMPGGGRLTIETGNVMLGSGDVGRHIGVAPGPYVVLSITDTGVGMDGSVRKRLFEPFFTTKEVGRGTGLGLSIVYGIVKQTGGDIWVYSEPGKGSTFRIYLPQASLEETAAAPPPEPAAVGSETVLLVEDEDVVRRFTRAILERHGYRVLEAARPSEALEIAERHQGDIQLLLSDVVMPEMSGPEMARKLGASRRGLRVLYMSGYPYSHISSQGLLAPDAPYIQKPFTGAALSRRIRELLT